MAVLPDAKRIEIWADWMQQNTETCGAITKADLRAAVNAIDDFLVANAVAINNAFPQPARAELTNAQKARIVAYVATKRWVEDA